MLLMLWDMLLERLLLPLLILLLIPLILLLMLLRLLPPLLWFPPPPPPPLAKVGLTVRMLARAARVAISLVRDVNMAGFLGKLGLEAFGRGNLSWLTISYGQPYTCYRWSGFFLRTARNG